MRVLQPRSRSNPKAMELTRNQHCKRFVAYWSYTVFFFLIWLRISQPAGSKLKQNFGLIFHSGGVRCVQQKILIPWSQSDFNDFCRYSGFLSLSKSTPNYLHLGVVLCFGVIHGPYSGFKPRVYMLSSARSRRASLFAVQSLTESKGLWLVGQVKLLC